MDNDGFADIFVSGVHRNTLHHNNHDGTFTDVTHRAGLDHPDAQFGPLWSVAALWVDVNGDGLLDLFVVNYLQWDLHTEAVCQYRGVSDYWAPSQYKGLPNQLFLNQRDGTFRDVSDAWVSEFQNRVGIILKHHVGKCKAGVHERPCTPVKLISRAKVRRRAWPQVASLADCNCPHTN